MSLETDSPPDITTSRTSGFALLTSSSCGGGNSSCLQLQLLSYMLWSAPLNMVVATSLQLMNFPWFLILFLDRLLLTAASTAVSKSVSKHPLSLMYTFTHVDKDLCYITTNTAAVADMAHTRAWWSGVRGRVVAYYMCSIQTEIEDTHYYYWIK